MCVCVCVCDECDVTPTAQMTSDRPAVEVVASHSARQEQQEGREEGGRRLGSDAGTISSIKKDSSLPTYFSQMVGVSSYVLYCEDIADGGCGVY